MNPRCVRLCALLLLLPACLAWADVRIDQGLAKARAALGSDEMLDSIRDLRFIGTVESVQQVPSKDDPTKMVEEPRRWAIDIAFQKPYRQRILLRSEATVEITALDGYDAWIKRVEVGREAEARANLLGSQQIKQLRANTWVHLSFFRGIESVGGSITYEGETEIDGVACYVMVFSHAGNIRFTRYFEKSTGRVVKMVNESGGEIREQGEIIVQGVRFPKTLINKSPDGRVSTITFESIKVNEALPASEFALPAEFWAY